MCPNFLNTVEEKTDVMVSGNATASASLHFGFLVQCITPAVTNLLKPVVNMTDKVFC